jgi:hypothetical protein
MLSGGRSNVTRQYASEFTIRRISPSLCELIIRGGKTIEGWAGVTPADSDDALRFAELRGARPMVETYPSGVN